MECINDKYNYLIELMNNPKWEVIDGNDNIVTEELYMSNSEIKCYRSHGLVNSTAQTLMDFVWNTYNKASLQKYDADIKSFDVVVDWKNIDFNDKYKRHIKKMKPRMCYQIYSLPWPIWPRDALYLQCKKVDGDKCWIFMFSVDSDLVPPHDDEYIRAKINIAAFGFIPEEKGTRVYKIVHIDPAGSIPLGLVNTYHSKTTIMINELQNIYGVTRV